MIVGDLTGNATTHLWRPWVQETVASDIRASVEYARSEYKPSSMAIMGFCFGGGRALEAAAAGEGCLMAGPGTVAFRTLSDGGN